MHSIVPVLRIALVVGLALCVAPSSAADKPTLVEIAKRGKAATAYLEIPQHGSASAFCVHPSGLFITNEHAVRGVEKAEITLVLDPSLKTQSVLKARVVRADQALDLALLRVDSAGEFASLPLGTIEGLSELMELIAFGYPLGRALSPDRKDYPSISVNSGKVTSLRLKEGELQHIQIDVTLAQGNSGGPVLDDQGRVVGVVVSGVRGTQGINQAIPVSHLMRFLKAPEIVIRPPTLKKDSLDQPAEFRASVASFLPQSPEYSVQLILSSDGEPRTFPMAPKGGEFIVRASPVKTNRGTRIDVTARFGSGSIAGSVEDAVVKVGPNAVRLSTIRRIESKPKRLVTLADGKVIEGSVEGMGTTELILGDQKVSVDLSKAEQLAIQPPEEITFVRAIVIVSSDGKELTRAETSIIVEDFSISRNGPTKPTTITPPNLDQEKVVKNLPDGFSEVVAGGGGKYLVFYLPKLKKLAIFDVTQARIARYISLAEDHVVYGAGLDKVVVGLPKKGVLQRWSLETGELEATVTPDLSEPLQAVVIGHASANLMVVNGYFYLIDTLKPIPIRNKDNNTKIWEPKSRVIPSADGTVYGGWNTHYSPDTASTWVVEGNEVKRYDEGGLHHVAPGPDGQTVYTARGFVSRTLRRGDVEDAKFDYCLPALQGNYFISLTSAIGGNRTADGRPLTGGFSIFLKGIRAPLIRMENADHGLSFDGWDREEFGPWKRVYLVPDAKLVAILPPSNDRVILYKVDLDDALEKSGRDYLLVASTPPPVVRAGTKFNYAIATKARNNPVSFKLESSPAGMRVSRTGVVEWEIPTDAAETHEVILSIKDLKGNEVFHTFKLKVTK